MLKCFGLLLAVASLANAGIVTREIRAPISVNIKNEAGKLSDIISEHKDLTVTFSLTQPIICASDETDCRVVVLIQNSRPDELVLSQCAVEWLEGQYDEKRNITVSTVENFVDDGERTFVLSTEVLSKSEFYKTKAIPDITIVTEPKNIASCSSTTDPNYKQWDGSTFLINSAGTFNLWKAPLRQWEVHARVNSRGFNCGVAIQDGCDRFTFDRCSGTLVARQHFKSTDGKSPKIIKDKSTSTTEFQSQRSGAIVKIVERIKISRAGRQVCGWSGCRIVYHTTRKDWLDIKMTAPGKDWGYQDNEEDPRTLGVCGLYDSANDGKDKIGTSWSAHVANYKVKKGQTLFEIHNACPTMPSPVYNFSLCKVPPKPVQRPILVTHDIEDITNIILTEQPDDKDDERITYIFDDEEEFEAKDVSPEFVQTVKDYCEHALLTTKAAELCKKLDVNLDRFVQACVNDITQQANETAFDDDSTDSPIHIELAEANLEEMQSQCIAEGLRRRENFDLVCNEDNDCETVCVDKSVNQSESDGTCEETCVGDCDIKFDNGDLDELVTSECPGNCGNNSRINNTKGGECVQNAEGKNKCKCVEGYTGEACEIVLSEQPSILSLFPFVCDITGECPETIAIAGEEFYNSENVSCKFSDGDEEHLMNATYITSEIIRCAMPPITHSGAAEKIVSVRLTIDGSTFSDHLPFLFHDASCQLCSRVGYCGRKGGTCVINNQCYVDGDRDPSNAGKCQVCNSDKDATGFSYVYDNAVCAPSLKRLSAPIQISERQSVGFQIPHEFLPFNLVNNPYTAGDTETKPVFSIGGADADFFEITVDGNLILKKGLDYETKKAFNFVVSVSLGGLEDSMAVQASISNVDEEATFSQSVYTASVDENSVQNNMITVVATDPDAGGQFGTVRYSLRINASDPSALQHFSIDEDSGIISVTKALDYESRAERFFSVVAESGGQISAKVVVEVKNVNEAPTAVRLLELMPSVRSVLTINESAKVDDVLGRFVVSDDDVADKGMHTLDLVDDSDGRFKLNNLNELVVKAGTFKFNDDTKKSFTIIVRATDPKSLVFDQELVLVVSDGNDKPGTISLIGEGTATALTVVPENQAQGVVGVLSVTDADKLDTHTYTLVNRNDLPFVIVGNELQLAQPLDFETVESYELQISATDDGLPEQLTSDVQTFSITVSDQAEVPGFFQFVPHFESGVPELTPGDSYIGMVTALDQDEDEDFVIVQEAVVDHSSSNPMENNQPFVVGNTTCRVSEETKYTMCSAPVYLNLYSVDFEANRITATKSWRKLVVFADDKTTEAVGRADLFVEIANENEAPSDVSVVSMIEGNSDGLNVRVEQGQSPRVATVTAVDVDDSCPSNLDGCQSFESTNSYSFQLVSGSSYKLAASCFQQMTIASRVATPCVVEVNGNIQPVGSTETIQVKTIDQSGLTSTTSIVLTVFPATVRVSVDFETIEEYSVDAIATLGTMTVSGWTESASPTVTVSGEMEPMVIVLVEERRAARATEPREIRYVIERKSTFEIDLERMDSPSLTFSVSVAAIGNFGGLDYSKVLTVTNVDEDYQASVCVAGKCTSPSTATLTVHNDAVASQIATLTFADPDTTNVGITTEQWSIETVTPFVNLFRIDSTSGVLSTRISAATANVPAGKYTLAIKVVSAGGLLKFDLEIVVEDDCKDQTCSGKGVCADRVNDYFCTCNEGFQGKDCKKVPIVEDDDEVIILVEESSTSGVSGGGIAGIVIALLCVILLVVFITMFVMNRNKQQKLVLDSLHYESNRVYESGAQYDTIDNNGIPKLTLDGGANPLYGTWYRSDMGKEAAYGVLSTSTPGTFIIRDIITDGVRNPMYCLHVKTPSQVIRDVNIDGSPGSMALLDINGAPQFGELNALVDHYSRPTDQPFVLNSMVMMDGMELYDNANIKNKAVTASAAPMKMKQLRQQKNHSNNIQAVAPGLTAI